jgi:hypothetical protein
MLFFDGGLRAVFTIILILEGMATYEWAGEQYSSVTDR